VFNLADYETVETRLDKFIKDFPEFGNSKVIESCQAVIFTAVCDEVFCFVKDVISAH